MKYVLLVLILSGCATTKETYTADGKVAYSISCVPPAQNWNDCYEQAGRSCGAKGYDVVQKAPRSLIVQCK
jgi:hypothetical protein